MVINFGFIQGCYVHQWMTQGRILIFGLRILLFSRFYGRF